jgi:hypothetical protein
MNELSFAKTINLFSQGVVVRITSYGYLGISLGMNGQLLRK